MKVCAGGGMPKITLGITGLLEILGRDYGIEKPYWEPLYIQHHAALLFRRVGPKIF